VKFLTYILSVYLLLLSVFPCADENSCTDKDETAASVSFSNNEHEEEESCTPFCSCSCCGLQFSKTCNCIKLKSPEPTAVHYAEEIQQQLSEIYFPIWQPPQLSAS
jgi:hypothetical protein